MHLIPSWAPNVHPLVIHFPIVLVLLALLLDAIAVVRPSPGLAATAVAAYALGAFSALVAVLTGSDASGEVFIPGMAHPMVEDHQHWALATTIALITVAIVRGVIHAVGRQPGGRGRRIALLAVTLALAVMVEQTAERGARLVYEEGIGVVAGPGPATPPSTDAATSPTRP